ncbi:MAG: hypothetical protein E6Z94_00800 [Streptococcus salivarius]|nr:hypothetical protein [Streptococcus salivarius]
MIDRSYLPFESARFYQDRKMTKWMGFFLSEHTTALSDDLNKVTYLFSLTLEKKLLLLSQVYANQLVTRLELRTKKGIETVVGTISTVTKEHLIIKTNEGHLNVPMDNILSIELAEGTQDESA